MPVRFEWEFEEDERPRRRSGPPPGPLNRRRLWRGGILLGLLLVISVVVRAWWLGNQRALAETEAALRAAVELELHTIAGQDVELFRSRQDPADVTWQERQIVRYASVTSSQFTPAPGLQPAGHAPEIRKVHLLGGDAQVDLTFWYDDATSRQTQPLPFYVTWSYRQVEDGTWYHTAPLDNWRKPFAASVGAPSAVRATPESLLEIQATQAEADLLGPIADELGRLVAQGCTWLGCPADAQFDLSFGDVPNPMVIGDRWRLPTSFLVGRPASAAAHDAWERALKRWLVEALAYSAVSDEMVTRTVLYEQLVQRLQVAFDLAEPPVPDVPLLARAVAAGEQDTLPELWVARRTPNDLGNARLRRAEVAAFLALLEQRVGQTRLLGLIPMLHSRDHAIDEVLMSLVGQDAEAFGPAWYTFLSRLTGERVLPFSTFPRVAAADRLLPPQPFLIPPARVPGDQIAMVCDHRVWVGNADGTDLVPLTPPNDWFYDLEWSPDGRWLLVRWVYAPDDARDGLYYLAADGGGGYSLTYDVQIEPRRRSLSPDGRYVAYDAGFEVQAVDVETGDTRRVPGMPIWSPGGNRLIYVSDDAKGLWQAGADWGDPRTIPYRSDLDWAQAIWSPDAARLAVPVHDKRAQESSVVVYDVTTKQLAAHYTVNDLAAGFKDQEQNYLTTGDPFVSPEMSLPQRVWPLGWSADGRQLLLWGQWTAGDPASVDVTLLARADGGGAPSIVLYGVETSLSNIAWSPTNPEQLILRWRPEAGRSFVRETVLFDLTAGPIYTAEDIWDAAWSPNGAWVATVGRDQFALVDSAGQVRFRFTPPGECREVVWNPAADLSRLGLTVIKNDGH